MQDWTLCRPTWVGLTTEQVVRGLPLLLLTQPLPPQQSCLRLPALLLLAAPVEIVLKVMNVVNVLDVAAALLLSVRLLQHMRGERGHGCYHHSSSSSRFISASIQQPSIPQQGGEATRTLKQC